MDEEKFFYRFGSKIGDVARLAAKVIPYLWDKEEPEWPRHVGVTLLGSERYASTEGKNLWMDTEDVLVAKHFLKRDDKGRLSADKSFMTDILVLESVFK